MSTYNFFNYDQDTMIHSVSIKSESPDQQAFDDLARELDSLPNSGYSYGAYGMNCVVADADINTFSAILIKKGIVEQQKKPALSAGYR